MMRYTVRNGLLVPKREVANKRTHLRVPRYNIILRRPSWYPIIKPITGAVAFDAKSTLVAHSSTFLNPNSTYTGVLTVGASASFLIIGVEVEISPIGGTVTGVLWNSVAMTQIGTISLSGTTPSVFQLWGLVSPTTGSQTLQVNWSGTSGASGYIFGISFTGTSTASVAAATKGFQTATTTSTTMSVTTTVSIAATEMAVAFGIDAGSGFSNTTTENMGGTQIGENQTLSNNGCAAYFTGSGSAVIASAALAGTDLWGAMIVGLTTPAAGGNPPYNPYTSQPQLASILAQKRKSFVGWNVNPDHRWRKQKGLLVLDRTLIKKAA